MLTIHIDMLHPVAYYPPPLPALLPTNLLLFLFGREDAEQKKKKSCIYYYRRPSFSSFSSFFFCFVGPGDAAAQTIRWVRYVLGFWGGGGRYVQKGGTLYKWVLGRGEGKMQGNNRRGYSSGTVVVPVSMK